jgi:hypothetical protein
MSPLRLVALVGLSAALLLPAACRGGRGNDPGFGVCQQTITWGGWDGTPQCAGLAATLIPAEDRACERDGDCVLVGLTTCGGHAVNQRAFPRFSGVPAPCSHPLAGMCPPANHRAACQAGCCVATAAPPPAPF